MKQDIEAIKGFRAVAFIIIFLSHSGVIWHDFGALSVSFFLVLSGFITFYAHEGKEMQSDLLYSIDFSRRKISRMYPLHLIMILPALAIQVVLIVVGREQFSVGEGLATLIPNIFLVHTWFPVNKIYFGYNGVAWYLSTYVFLCFMFPLLFNIMKRWNIRKAFISMGVCIIVPVILSFFLEIGELNQYREWLLYVFPPVRLMDYFAGMQVGWLFCNKPRKMECRLIVFFQVGIVLLSILMTKFIGVSHWDSMILRVISESVIVYMPIAIMGIYLVAQDQGFINKFLKNKFLVCIGKVSMYAFLIHYPVLQYTHIIMTNSVSDNVSSVIIFAVAMLITAGLTWLYLKVKRQVTVILS